MMNTKAENLRELLKYFPEKLRRSLIETDCGKINDLFEIRLRAEQPVTLVFSENVFFISENGRFTPFYNSNVLKLSEREVKRVFESMCSYSVYSLTQNICKGFITVENGCRVGVYGTAVIENGCVCSVRNIKGLNIRLAGDYNGISSGILDLFENSRPNILICGPPSCGKTTFLKDLSRNLSDKFNCKIAVVDERAEFESYYLGYNTDVLTGYPKPIGIMQSVRTLSPDIIIFDELGEADEVKAITEGMNSGVNFVMSIHCKTKQELTDKKQFNLLMSVRAVDYLVFLKNKAQITEIVSVSDLNYEDAFIDNGSDRLHSIRTIHR